MKFVPSRCSSNSCPCHLPSDPPLLQTREHVLLHCVQFERARDELTKVCPQLTFGTFSLGCLFSPSNLPTLITFIMESAVFSKSQAPVLESWSPPPQDETDDNCRPSQAKDPPPVPEDAVSISVEPGQLADCNRPLT